MERPRNARQTSIVDVDAIEPLLILNNAPHPSEKRYCSGRLTVGWFRLFMCLTSLIVLGVASITIIFTAGRSLAQNQLNDASISITMSLFNPTADSIGCNVTGTVDNRGAFSAQLESTIISLYFQETPFATMEFPVIKAMGGASTPLSVQSVLKVTSAKNFDAFTQALVTRDRLEVLMKAKITTVALGITFTDLDFNKVISMNGFFNMAQPPVAVLQQTITGGSPDNLRISLLAQLYNPSSVSFPNLGPLRFKLLYKDVFVGWTSSNNNVTLSPGPVLLNQTATFTRTPENADKIQEILSLYTQGAIIGMVLAGDMTSIQIPLLQAGFSVLRTSVALVGLVHKEQKLIDTVFQHIDGIFTGTDTAACPHTAHSKYVDLYVFTNNPLGIPLTTTKTYLELTWEGGSCDAFSHGPFLQAIVDNKDSYVIPAYGSIRIIHRACLVDDFSPFQNYLEKCVGILTDPNIRGGKYPFALYFNINGTLSGSSGDFPFDDMRYTQEHLLTITRFNLL
jgi:hypothetical protein